MTTTQNPQDDGGPAFPQNWRTQPQDMGTSGLSIRDYFAAKALQGLCANPGGPFQACSQSGWTLVNCTFDQIAEEAYALANAMLRARQESSHG